jgi:hypothetical protein
LPGRTTQEDIMKLATLHDGGALLGDQE